MRGVGSAFHAAATAEHHTPRALHGSTRHSLPFPASPEMANPQHFLGSSLVAWHGLSLPISQPWHLNLMFRTRQADGVLLQAVTRGRSTITLQVMQGRAGWPWPGRRALVASRGLDRSGWAGPGQGWGQIEATGSVGKVNAATYWA